MVSQWGIYLFIYFYLAQLIFFELLLNYTWIHFLQGVENHFPRKFSISF